MATPKPTTPTPTAHPQSTAGVSATMPPQSTASVSATIIAEVGNGVTRLAAVAAPLASAAANAVTTNLPRLLDQVRASLDTTELPQARGDLAAAASDLVSAGARLSLGLLNAAVRGLDAVSHAVSTEATDSSGPPRT